MWSCPLPFNTSWDYMDTQSKIRYNSEKGTVQSCGGAGDPWATALGKLGDSAVTIFPAPETSNFKSSNVNHWINSLK